MFNFLSRCLMFVKVRNFHLEPQNVSLCGYCMMVFVHIIAFILLSRKRTLFAKKSGFSSTEYAAFCHSLSCQESFDFIFGNLEAYCQGVEDEQTRDAAREF